MRSLIVVVPHILVENSLKVAPAPDQQPIQAFLSDRPHPALGGGVRIRRMDRVLMIWVPSATNTLSKARVNLVSRSWTRN
jgi:hypothetical protein